MRKDVLGTYLTYELVMLGQTLGLGLNRLLRHGYLTRVAALQLLSTS